MARKTWSVVINTKTIEDIEKKFEKVKVYGEKKGYRKIYLGNIIEILLSKENMDTLDLEDFFKK